MTKDPDREEAIRIAIKSKAVVRRAIEERINQQEVFDAARDAALASVKDGAAEAEAIYAAAMAYYGKIKETCGSEDEPLTAAPGS